MCVDMHIDMRVDMRVNMRRSAAAFSVRACMCASARMFKRACAPIVVLSQEVVELRLRDRLCDLAWTCACMCVCMCVHVCACTCVHVCVCVCACRCAGMCTGVHGHASTDTGTDTHAHNWACTLEHVCRHAQGMLLKKNKKRTDWHDSKADTGPID